jgi:hypothetical protein
MSLAPQTVTLISEDDFFTHYEPREQPDGNTIHEHHSARQFPINHVWSIIEHGNSMYATPGYAVVNCIGYAVTEKAWEDENLEAVWYRYPDDFDHLDEMSDEDFAEWSQL